MWAREYVGSIECGSVKSQQSHLTTINVRLISLITCVLQAFCWPLGDARGTALGLCIHLCVCPSIHLYIS